jgi:hypothetical protein
MRNVFHQQDAEIERLREGCPASNDVDCLKERCKAADEIELLRAVREAHVDEICEKNIEIERLRDYKRKYLFLRSLARYEARDYEEPRYAWSIRFRSSCATAENAIRQALEDDE